MTMFVENSSRINNDILNELFIRYYQSAEKSHLTSSYWKKYGSRDLVEKSGERVVVSGYNFDSLLGQYP